MRSILPLALITYKEGIRNRSVFGILLFSLFIFGLNIAVSGLFMREIGKVTVDVNLSALSFSGLLLVLFVGLNLMVKDIDRKTVQLVLSKPISRPSYILGKYLGLLMFILVSLSVLLVLSCATVVLLSSLYPDYFGTFSWGIYLTAAAFIFVKLAVLAAALVLFSSLSTSSFIALIFTVSTYLAGQTIEEVVFYLESSFRTAEVAPALHNFIAVISFILPNLAVFDFAREAAHGIALDPGAVLFSLGYAASYAAVLLVLAAIAFSRREFN
ncbi:ABC transporter permease subunit [Geoalkalibacter halelectricus]|uniref:ABC transporter permease subunit n=1 Tax=Geoalkalibacter halelectricus TaxID=2847045 RepID=UPI003D256669